jgi:hypothetical protein
MPGAVPYGFHEGSRSEYLAQYVFGSWGTAVAIPHQEDHGIDLTCTLMEQVGKRYLAKWPYTVQVKSNMDPVVFEGQEAVRWVIEHPLPLFLCVVDKASAHLSVYHTLPRFYAWSLGEWPERLEMVPAPFCPGQDGRGPQWGGSDSYSLDQPILDFTITQMLDNDFWSQARRVFDFWVKLENDNLTRVRTNLLKCRIPGSYRTNEDWVGSWVELWLLFPNDEQFGQAASRLREPLEWVGEQLSRKGDLGGAAKAALLHRHLYPEDRGTPLFGVQQELNLRLGRKGYVYAGVDYLGQVVGAALAAGERAGPRPPAGPPPAPNGAPDEGLLEFVQRVRREAAEQGSHFMGDEEVTAWVEQLRAEEDHVEKAYQQRTGDVAQTE